MKDSVGKKGCTPAIWVKTAHQVAAEYGVDAVHILAGSKSSKFVGLRWEAWRRLAARNFSYASIGRVSGFDHTTVRYGCRDDVRNAYLVKSPQRVRLANPMLYVEAA